MQILGIIKISADLKVITGLHIGGQVAGISIGATDNPVIKTNGKPYIPGSSLKGKIRGLLELGYGKEMNKDGRHECPKEQKACDICVVFGRSAELKSDEGPTRVIFRDCNINGSKSDENARKNGYVEIKWENSINRITSKVDVGLRDIERVLPGTVFDVEIMFKVYDIDVNGELKLSNLKDMPNTLKRRFKLILEGMKMLEDDYLGGCGSRGYGKVKFENLKIEYIPIELYRRGGEPIKIFEGILEEAIKQ